ncbi:bacillithiol biosynthesis deacetylase BshB2 [Geomicrobium sp. JSM 1781026]|uniref:bacillithiol biosynthesis deacetylase BshB2 n=1 Tax=Geomicrobium sp. JSM 1781026 TaxID=3344580 RepID=UPI0035BF20AD
MKKFTHLLLIFPHPDDETFSAAGTVQLYKNTYQATITCASLTAGEMGRNFGTPPMANRETLPRIRKEELEDACRIMGVDRLHHLGFRDKTLEFEQTEFLANTLRDLIEKEQPDLVITFDPELSIHPDHNATGRAVIQAVGSMPKSARPQLYTKAITADAVDIIGEPHIIYDISDYMPLKKQAIAAHRSQALEVNAITKQKLKEGADDPEAWIRYEQFWVHTFEDE